MSIVLFPHNQKAYQNAVKIMQEEGRAAVIHPTGTGKSFIAFKLAEDHPGKKICWLAPSEYIFRSQRENYLEAGGEASALSEITFLTYAKLMYGLSVASGNEGTICRAAAGQGFPLQEAPDYIILDEFHRCGAESWGSGVAALLEAFPKAEVLGLSATHIRFLDSRRDMAQELFQGQIASKMNLTEAIAEGILPAPLYICGLYEYKGELRKLSSRVRSQRNAGVRDEGVKLLEKLRRSLQCADGPKEIFSRYMKKDGKYIVFCSGRKHMEEMISLAGQWFQPLDREPAIYRAAYDNSGSPEEVRKFREDGSGHLKLLYCIDMLNEGVHVADVDGAVLLRPTASPTLYLQQVGRALSVPDRRKHQNAETAQNKEAENAGQPIIFDMVDNFDSLRCIDSFLEEYGSVSDRKNARQDVPRYSFRLIDETRDSRKIFGQLCRCLASSWEACYQKAEEYYAEYGSLKVPKRYVTEDGISLGSWLQTQRRVRAGVVPGNLSREQIEKLDRIGMEWESRVGKAWERGYQELVRFRQKNGHVDVPVRFVTEEGYPLGKFVSNQRAAWRNTVRMREIGKNRNNASAGRNVGSPDGEKPFNGKVESNIAEKEARSGNIGVCADGNGTACSTGRTLTAERERKLTALGFVWEKTGQGWDRYYAAAKEYFEKEGDLNVPVKYVTEDGLRLGAWIQGRSDDRESLPEEKVRALEEIGMRWGSRYDTKWDEKYHLAEQYYRERGNLEIPKGYTVQGVNPGRWICALRSDRERPDRSHYRLDAERIRQLDRIGMRWGGESWEIRYRLAESYYREHGDLKVSQAYVAEAGGARIWLGKWLAEQRRRHNSREQERHALTEEQERRLEAIGMEW